MLCLALTVGSAHAGQLPNYHYRIDKSPTTPVSLPPFGRQHVELDPLAGVETVDPVAEQPHYSHNEAIALSERLGLRTDFPL